MQDVYEKTIDGEVTQDDWLRKAAVWWDRFWTSPVLESALARRLTLAAIALICLARVYCGLHLISYYTHDLFTFIDGAWRMFNGQRPHVDFYSGLGFLTYVQTELGLMVANWRAEGIVYGNVAVALLCGCAAYVLSRKRLADVPCILITLFTTLVAVAPFNIGESPMRITMAMFYNREGYAILNLILLESMCAPIEATNEFWTGLLTGVLTAALLFLKVSYFGAAVLLVLGLIFVRRQPGSRWLGIVLGGISVLVAGFIYLGGIGPFMSDMTMLSRAKHFDRWVLEWRFYDVVRYSMAPLAAFSLSAVLISDKERTRRSLVRIAIATACVAAVGLITLAGNWQEYLTPTNATLAIILVSGVLAATGTSPARMRTMFFTWAAVLILVPMLTDALGLAYMVRLRQSEHTKLARLHLFEGPLLANMTSEDNKYVDFFNEGYRLLKRNLRPNDTVMTFDFLNPYSWALGLRPAEGGSTWMHYQTNFNEQWHPSPERFIGSASLILVPTDPKRQETAEYAVPIYGDYLHAHFQLIDRTKSWDLYRRE